MKDMMMEVYNVLSANPTIAKEVTAKNIKFYEVPESFDSTKPFIIIDTPLGPPTSAYYAANKEMSQTFSYQINVETQSRILTKEIAKAVKAAMWEFGYAQLNGGLDEYFSETKRFVDARRYRKHTQIHDTDY
ncbi:TPA: hypothetical protein JC407_004614 [Salmonella enterica]|nr:hypothetical protein [Salmonella enterica]HAU2858767.1 hypothetical protein [Salmonella enterica]HAU3184148.1 hypothetical protein [Salmonella enterica]